jgi:hypothetical protein
MQKAADVVREEGKVTCDACFFRRAALCAIRGNTPCPTFRPADDARGSGRLSAPRRDRERRPLAPLA